MGSVKHNICTGKSHPFEVKRPTVHIAWTIDDGPTVNTIRMNTEMVEAVVAERRSLKISVPQVDNLVPATWYIQRDTYERHRNSLKALQDEGDEIAIHSFHPTKNHCEWFPQGGSLKAIPAAGVRQGNISRAYSETEPWNGIREAMTHLTEFVGLLREHGLMINFVRLPGGLRTEMMKYLEHNNVERNRRGQIIKEVIEAVTSESPGNLTYSRKDGLELKRLIPEDELRTFYSIIQQTLVNLRLHLWEGSHVGPELTMKTGGQSWQAEVGPQRDTATSGLREMIQALEKNPQSTQSLVILTHESKPYRDRVLPIIRGMEKLAHENKVDIQYHTMTSLFCRVRSAVSVS